MTLQAGPAPTTHLHPYGPWLVRMAVPSMAIALTWSVGRQTGFGAGFVGVAGALATLSMVGLGLRAVRTIRLAAGGAAASGLA